ncbi:MAG TPA: tetratricopeptide repeat protein [Gemmatimonadaceae bacterium]|nr:tetratricopeptide repeat protein [Gemmatimonadaceae bacterium]
MAIPVTTQSSTARAEFMQGIRDLDAERNVDARRHFNAAATADPNFAMAHYYSAIDGESFAAYRRHLDEAIRTMNGASPAEQLWIRAEQKSGDNDINSQIAIAEQLVQMTPSDPRAYQYLANAQLAANQRAQSRATLERAIQVQPNFAPALIQLGNFYLITEPRDVAKSEIYFRRALAIAPNEAFVHDYMGDLYRAQNNLSQARAEYTRMAELSSTRGEAYQQRGHVNSFMGNYAEARADYDRAVALSDANTKPGYADSHALVSVYAGDPRAAEEELERLAASVDPNIPSATGQKIGALQDEAQIALHNGHLDVAQRAIDMLRPLYRQQGVEGGSDAARRNSEFNIGYWEGMLAARRGDYATARQKAQDMMAQVAPLQNPRKNEGAHEVLAMADLLQGNYQSAAAHFAEANPDDVYLWYQRGLALEGAGRSAEAKEYFRKAAGWNFNGAGTALVKSAAAKKAG